MKRQTERNDFEWVDGSNFEGFRGEITYEPGFSSSSRGCVFVARESENFVAKTKECFARSPFICQKRGAKAIWTNKRFFITLLLISFLEQ